MSTEPITEPKQRPVLFKIKNYEVTKKRAKWGLFGSIFVLALIALIVSIIYTEIYIHSFDIRVDCNPDLPLNYDTCLKRGCIWVQRSGPEVPPCFFPHGYGYRSTEIRPSSNGYHIKLSREPKKTVFGNEQDLVNLIVTLETSKRLRLKFNDGKKRRYEVPLDVPPPPAENPKEMEYIVQFENDPQFGVKVVRNSTGTTLFDSNVPGMIFSDQFLQITTKLASSYIYGLGEHTTEEHVLNTDWKKMSMFARDVATMENTNLYGVHPFYINVENDGNAHGVFFLNSNAMEVVLQPNPALTFRTIGGILDIYIFLGPTPEEVVQQYLQVIGLPMLPPYWSLGFHLSRYGYKNTKAIEAVAKRTIEKNIPYDVQHLDIDYMQDYRDFEIDESNFKGLSAFVMEKLHKQGIKVIAILDPGIASNKTLKDTYPALKEGIERNIFIKINGTDLEGKVWPGKVYYPDFTNPKIQNYWNGMCGELRKKLQFDGLWIDMNEPSSFVDGSLTGCGKNSWNYPPYHANVLGSKNGGKIFEKTICMDADHSIGKHYNLHSLYGFFQAGVTFKTLTSIIPGKNRPMVLSRSTYPGSGRNTAHWLGDNFSTWPQLRASIPGILNFNSFGIPFVGADICGFIYNTTEELCLRWMQLGAFYPFSRNHNTIDAKDQDPAIMGDEVVQASVEALSTRYTLLPYLYTLFHIAHTKGATVARPLFHEFPTDKKTWTISYQFLWGPALLISPVVYEGADNVEAHFPEGIWYEFKMGKMVKEGPGATVILPADKKNVNLHVRGGYILPCQMPSVTTTKSRTKPMILFVSPDESGKAKGQLYWDDGISLDAPYLFLEFLYQQDSKNATLSTTVKNVGFQDSSKPSFGFVTLCNQKMAPNSIEINGKEVTTVKFSYNKDDQVLSISSLKLVITEKFNLTVNY